MDNKTIGRKFYLAYGLLFAGICCVASTIMLEFKSCEPNAAETTGQVLAYKLRSKNQLALKKQIMFKPLNYK